MMNTTGRVVFLLLIIISNSTTSKAQNHSHNHDHSHHNSHHVHAANELGVGNFLSYLAGEQEFAYGLHIHYLRAIKDTRLGLGLGYEQIFDEHYHKTVGIIGSYRPLQHLIITFSPGLLFPNSENPKSRFVTHYELVYEFELGRIHLGPTIEFSTTFEEYHIGAGIHLGYAF